MVVRSLLRTSKPHENPLALQSRHLAFLDPDANTIAKVSIF